MRGEPTMIQTMRATIQSVLLMLAFALFGPVAASAAQGEFVVATQAATDTTLTTITTLTTGQWVRFAESSVSDGGNNAGVFDIRWTGTTIGGHVRVSIGANSNDETQIGMVLNDASSQGAPAIGKVRLLEGAAGTRMYLEAYVGVALLSLEFVHEAGYGWTLVPPAVTLSTTLTAHELDTTGAFAVNEGSKSFMVTKGGNVGIGTTTPGQKLSVAGTIESSSGGFKFPDGTTQLSVGTAAGWTENATANTVYTTTTGRNIGIGTTGPKNKLDVEGGLAVGATYSGTNTAPTNGLLVEGNTGIGTTTPVNKLDVEGGLVIGATYSGTNTAPANGLLVEGNTGIGTTTPKNKLDVEGGLAVGATYSGTNTAPTNGLLVEGNTGIGTTAPVNKLDVEGGLAVGATYSGTNAAPANGLLVEGNVGIGTTTVPFGKIMIAAPAVPLAFQETDVNVDQGGFWRMPLDAGILRFDVNTSPSGNFVPYTTALAMTKAGNVGIGTTTPVNKLDVEGGLAVGATYSGTNSAPANGLLVEGNVGIGTTAPVNKLDVEGGLAVGATYSGTNTAPTNGLLVEGNVGIGTTTVPFGKIMIAAPAVPLAFQETDVNVDQGGFWRMPLDAGILRFDVNTSPSGNFVPYTTALAMTKAGNVGIGTIAPTHKLTVIGDATKSLGGTSWAVYSDTRLKTIAGTFDAGLNEVLKLQPIRYRYKKDNPLHLPNESEHIGFSAQEVQKIIPGAISENSQGYLMLNSDPILWAMLNAIKELTAKVSEMDTLKVQLKELQDILRPTMAKR